MPTKYYQKKQERLQKEARESYQNLSAGEKNKKWKKACERHQNFSEKEKENNGQYYREQNENLSEDQRLVEYRREYYITHNK